MIDERENVDNMTVLLAGLETVQFRGNGNIVM